MTLDSMIFDYIFFLLFLIMSALGISFWLNVYEQRKRKESQTKPFKK
jgi:hypothetical protein